MTDAHTPAVLRDEDQGSLPAAPRPSVPTEPLDDPWAELERLAKAAKQGREAFLALPLEQRLEGRPDWWIDWRNYADAATPATILKLIEAARQGPAGYEPKANGQESSDVSALQGEVEERGRETKAALDRLDAEVAYSGRLEEALKPFAAMAGAGDQRPKDDAVWAGQDGLRITYGDFRRAKAAMEPQQ